MKKKNAYMSRWSHECWKVASFQDRGSGTRDVDKKLLGFVSQNGSTQILPSILQISSNTLGEVTNLLESPNCGSSAGQPPHSAFPEGILPKG